MEKTASKKEKKIKRKSDAGFRRRMLHESRDSIPLTDDENEEVNVLRYGSLVNIPGAPLILSPDEHPRSMDEQTPVRRSRPLHHHIQSRLGSLTKMKPIHLICFTANGRWKFKVGTILYESPSSVSF